MEGPCAKNLGTKVGFCGATAVGHCDDTNLYPCKLHMPIHPLVVSTCIPFALQMFGFEQPGCSLN